MIKDNQPAVSEAVSLLFADPPWGDEFPEARQEGSHGNRHELHRLRASPALNDCLEWPDVGQGCCLERTRVCNGTRTEKTSYAITSLKPEEADPARLLELWPSPLGDSRVANGG